MDQYVLEIQTIMCKKKVATAHVARTKCQIHFVVVRLTFIFNICCEKQRQELPLGRSSRRKLEMKMKVSKLGLSN